MALASCSSNGSNSENTEATDSVVTEVVETQVETTADSIAAAPAASDAVIEITEDKAPAPADGKAVVIDFSATWCGPCQKFKPIYHQVAGEYAAKANFYSADLDNLKALAEQFNVTSIPCIVIIKDGAEPVSRVGYMEESEFKELLDKNI